MLTSILPASESETLGTAIRFAEPFNRNRPGFVSLSTSNLMHNKNVRGTLDLVDYCTLQPTKESYWIIVCSCQDRCIVEGEERDRFGRDVGRQCGFSGLPRPGYEDNARVGECLLYLGFCESVVHFRRL